MTGPVSGNKMEALQQYAALLNAQYADQNAEINLKFEGDSVVVTGKDVEGKEIFQTLEITESVMKELKELINPQLESPVAPPITFRDLQDIKGSYFDSSVLTVVGWMIVEVQTKLTKQVRNQETEMAVKLLNYMQDAIENIRELKELSADMNYQAAIRDAEAKITGGILQVVGSSLGVLTGVASMFQAGQALAGLSTSLSELGKGASQIIEGEAGVESAKYRLRASMADALVPVVELLKAVLEQSRQQAREAIQDYAQNLSNIISRFEQLMDQVARDNRLSG